MHIFKSLSREQKKSIGLLQIGTFLEYFDLMLYVHMSVFLNDLFFPPTDPITTKILAATAFCSSFVLRPIGALFFGWIGDNFGRQPAVAITMLLMAFSCGIMVFVPTYASIGITATIVVTCCRLLQGMASMGEIVGAEIYLTETIKPPTQYTAVALISVASVLGTVFALIFASLSSAITGENWRWAFGIGSAIAIAGSAARTFLRETPDFLHMQARFQKRLIEKQQKEAPPKESSKTFMMLCLMQCAYPICFYFAFMYCGSVLKETCHYTSAQVIQQNLAVSIIQLITLFVLARMGYSTHPLKILKARMVLFFIFALIAPYVLLKTTSPIVIFCLQSLGVIFGPYTTPATSIFYKHLPTIRRFTTASLSYAVARSSMYLITSFGLVAVTLWFGPLGVWLALFPAAMFYRIGVLYFWDLEKRTELKNANTLPHTGPTIL